MARIPTAAEISGPGSLRTGRSIARQDTTAEGRGLADFGSGLRQAGAVAVAFGEQERQKALALELSKADAQYNSGLIGIENGFNQDGNYSTWGQRAQQSTQELLSSSANLISDPEARQLWLLDKQAHATGFVDRIGDRSFARVQEQQVVDLGQAIETNYNILTDPSRPEEERERARLDIEGAIAVNEQTGLLAPGTAQEWRETFLQQGDYALGQNAVDSGEFTGPLPQGDTAAILRSFEGFQTSPYWDVNAYRIGYGSDTITRADGSVVRVQPGMMVTREDAERDLARRIREFEQVAVRNVGVDAWAALPPQTRAALTSVTYNYGEIPPRIRDAVRGGDPVAIADAVASLQNDNGGVNRERRLKEAAIIRGEGNPEWYQRLPPTQRIAIDQMAASRQSQQASAAQARAQSEYAAHKGSIELGIRTRDIVSEQQILNDAMLTDSDKATLLNTLRTEVGRVSDAQNFLASWQAGQSAGLNPFNSDNRRLVDDVFDELQTAVPAEQREAATTQLIADTGVVPSQAIADVRQGLTGTDTAAVTRALQTAAMLTDTAPQGLMAVEHGREVRDAADMYNALVNGRGFTAEQAAQQYMRMNDPAQQQRVEVLQARWTEDRKSLGPQDIVQEFGAGFLGFGAVSTGVTIEQQEAVLADYMSFAEDAYLQANGDIAVTKQLAIQEMRRTYGVSSVSGNAALMKFPPENFFPSVAGSHDYLRDIVMRDARSIEATSQNAMLVGTTETAQDVSAGMVPRYNLYYQTPDGVWNMAPQMFTLGDEVQQLQTLQSQRNQLEGERARVMVQWRQDVQSGMPLEEAQARAEAADAALVEQMNALGGQASEVRGNGPVEESSDYFIPNDMAERLMQEQENFVPGQPIDWFNQQGRN
ncbi:lysozyme [Pelagibacterium luteolum]|uniref:Lysozyme n=1 Tax=Pelagibacterium luteolum TaxID=440168 RepID=A0A1G7ZKC8_9HYPH|nr:hypothetical protein [Pelagibacterium luteolum]SDH08560.1 Phage-related lysozyme (muramidase), GH24 family [Pelagibacterium luteolum]